MGESSDKDEKCHRLYHVVAVLSDSFLCFTSVERIERQILSIALELMYDGCNTFTVYDRRGLLCRYFHRTYGNCIRRPVHWDSPMSSKGEYSEYFSCFESEYDSTDLMDMPCSYFLEREGSTMFVSPYQLSQHECIPGIRLCLIDQRHAHIRILSASRQEYQLPDEWIEPEDVTFDDVSFKYRVPTDDHICQPDLQRHLCTVDGVESPLPDLVVSVHLDMREALRFCVMILYMKLLMLVIHLFPKLFKPRIQPIFDMSLLCSSLWGRLGAMCLRGKYVIYSFGPCGIPPWFLAEAEIHQCFGMDIPTFRHCMNAFYSCQRKNGK